MKALLVFGMSMVTATSIVGLTACGDEHDHVDENNDGKCDICQNDMTPQGDDSGTNLKVPVEKVELNKTDLTLEIGDEETLTATVTPDTATVKAVNWSVEPAGVVDVVGGKVTAKAAGTATITATADGKSATCSVTVNAPAPKPEVTKEEWEAALSETAFTNFTATSSMTATEDEEETAAITYKVDLPNGKYYHNDSGDAYYSKEAEDKYYKYSKAEDSEDYSKDEITAEEYAEGLHMESSPLNLTGYKDIFEDVDYNPEKESYIGTGVLPSEDIPQGFDVEFKFDNGKLIYAVIYYDDGAPGMVFELSAYGTTTVDLPKVGGDIDKVDVEKVELNKNTLTLDIGDEETLTATVTPDNADDKTVSWTSSDPSVATVDDSGKVTAVAVGTATITATADGQSATCNVTVNDPNGEHVKVDVEKVELNKNTLTLKVGGEETLTATVTPDNADDKTVSWTSSDPSVATVDDSGKVTAVAVGTATITATADGQSATCSVTVNPSNETGIALTFSNVSRYGGANNDENVEMTVKYDIGEDAIDMGADKQFDAAYINGTKNADTGWADQGTPGGTHRQAHLWLRGFKAEYDTEYVITLKKGDTVVATGTLLIETPKSMAVSSDTENALIGNILTLNPEDVVMLEASITGNFPEGAAYKWQITKGGEYIELESEDETAIITAKEYSGEDNLTAEVTVTYGVEGTTVSKVISVTVKGSGNNGDDPYAAITLVLEGSAPYAPEFFEFVLTNANQPSGITYAAIKESCTSYKIMVAGDEEKTNLAGTHWNMFVFGPPADNCYHLQLQNTAQWKSGTTYNIEFYNGSTLIAVATVNY